MKEVFTLWRYTRMVVLVALTAALYPAILIPFKVAIPFVPGFTELRPANVIPIVCSLLFGPAAAWGSAFGNLIGDFFGTLGPGSLFGFFGNFLYGYLPYKMWKAMGGYQFSSGTTAWRRGSAFVVAALVGSLACGIVIGWGVDMFGLVPFSALGNIIFLNNFIVSVILGPFLMAALYTRLGRWGLIYTEIMDSRDLSGGKWSKLGVVLVLSGVLSGIFLGNLISLGIYRSGFLGFGFAHGSKGELGLALGLLPSVVLIFLGAILA